MSNKSISAIIIIIITSFTLTSCNNVTDPYSHENNIKFFEETTPYSKEENNEYNYKITNDKLSINSKSNNLNIKKSNTSEIKISMKKIVGGKNEDKLQEALNDIQCSYENNTIQIGPIKDDSSIINSNFVETIINIPESITSLEIISSVGDVSLEGDYNNLKVHSNIGDFSYKGILKEGSIDSITGEVKMNLVQLENSYKYDIDGKIGDINIKLPKNGSICLTGAASKKAKIGKEIYVNETGAVFNINKTISEVEIDN
ncbi:hypothetical protein GKZ28_06115 [Clostridium chromiireducens]|uniref:DUF4097 family beta strand repeat protein n=1 Tax=Clostridium chromiireducens TaxID=225345 RepID=A0A964RKJ8_9CLOT|nr:DUF4097 domain-containing protein [Clostridium chromiireducens]MVX63273.1 hypothetical protein [Clostridium chromiireducens]